MLHVVSNKKLAVAQIPTIFYCRRQYELENRFTIEALKEQMAVKSIDKIWIGTDVIAIQTCVSLRRN